VVESARPVLVRDLSRLHRALRSLESLPLLFEIDVLGLKLLLLLHQLLVGGIQLLRFFQQFLILLDDRALSVDLVGQNLVLFSKALTQCGIIYGRIVPVRRYTVSVLVLAALLLWQRPGMAERDNRRAHVGSKRIVTPHSCELNFIE
jgi:hypothetical protein